jgi:polar amino acid transport system substrate-binding protein
MPITERRRRLPSLLVACFAALALTATACGSDDDSSTGTSAATTSSTGSAIELPAEFADKGTLTVATDAAYPPNEFIGEDGEEIVGMSPDLITAIAEELGVEVELVNAPFDSILPGLQSGKYDIGMSSFTDTKEREEVVDFVTYFRAGTSFFTRADDPTEVQGLEDLCGLRVAVQKGTTQQIDVQKQSDECTANGEEAVQLSTFPTQDGANLALQSGRADISLADSPVADWQVKQSDGAFVSTGEPYGTAPYGIAVPKDSGLAEPIQQALQNVMDSGRYEEILTEWGIEAGAIDEPVINGAES